MHPSIYENNSFSISSREILGSLYLSITYLPWKFNAPSSDDTFIILPWGLSRGRSRLVRSTVPIKLGVKVLTAVYSEGTTVP